MRIYLCCTRMCMNQYAHLARSKSTYPHIYEWARAHRSELPFYIDWMYVSMIICVCICAHMYKCIYKCTRGSSNVYAYNMCSTHTDVHIDTCRDTF